MNGRNLFAIEQNEEGNPKCWSWRGEKLITEELTKRKISFEKEKYLNETERLRFDFFITKIKIII